MVKGLSKPSGQIIISGNITESALNTFTQSEVDLQLNVLDREVFVVTSVDLDVGEPDAQAAVNSASNMSLSTTSRATLGNLGDSNVLARATLAIRAAGFVDAGVSFQQQHPETPQTAMDTIGIIATNNFFVQIQGTNNLGAKAGQFRIWGHRMIASADVFAALTQSELLSA